MSLYQDNMEKLRSLTDLREERFNKPRRTGGALSPKSQVEHEKRMRREIANSNERRRMQSINTGFESLKTLLPTHDGEKLSKAAILQLTTKFITNLVSENRRLSSQLTNMRQLAMNSNSANGNSADPGQPMPSPPSRKRKADSDVLEDSLQVPTMEDLIRENSNLKNSLDEERSQREQIEDQIRSMRDSKLRTELCEQLQLSETPLLVKKQKPGYEEFAVEQLCTESDTAPASVATTHTADDNVSLANSGSLDHLVMAIEQIEGKFSCAGRQQVAHRRVPSAAAAVVPSTSPALDTMLQAEPVPSTTPGVHPMISPFTSATVNIPLAARNKNGTASESVSTMRSASVSQSDASLQAEFVAPVAIVSSQEPLLIASDDKKSQQDYPIVSKLLNRPIPHKYLHRSHVVVNSSH